MDFFFHNLILKRKKRLIKEENTVLLVIELCEQWLSIMFSFETFRIIFLHPCMLHNPFYVATRETKEHTTYEFQETSFSVTIFHAPRFH